jgi:hypothetical protein
MTWYTYLAYFFAGAFLANGIPHFIHGISGKRFPTPFAKSMSKGKSSPVVNVIWGVVNFLIGYALVFDVGQFQFGFSLSILMLVLGGIVTSAVLALILGHMRE